MPLGAQLTTVAIMLHTGSMFGLVGQVLLAALVVGLLCMLGWGYRMWWLRRPTRSAAGHTELAAPPARRAMGSLPVPVLMAVVLLAAAYSWLAPLFGISVVAFLLVDGVIGLAGRRRAAARADR